MLEDQSQQGTWSAAAVVEPILICGAYTVDDERRQETPDTVIRMGEGGRRRLGTNEEFAGVVDSRGPHPSLNVAAAETAGELVERLTPEGRNALYHKLRLEMRPKGDGFEVTGLFCALEPLPS